MIRLPEFPNDKQPVLMLNLLKFNDRKLYFETYLPAFKKVTAELGLEQIRIVMAGDFVANILASGDDQWDAYMLVEYPDANAFKTVAESEAYHTMAGPHRIAALKDLKLFMTKANAL
ncbi:MAG: hypothetical protein EOO02_21275 [Chitinophagaceae bacterium]|nr:MAG: hypothetical protein EOO02_21275 [Chitinophagaceae bacterium]